MFIISSRGNGFRLFSIWFNILNAKTVALLVVLSLFPYTHADSPALQQTEAHQQTSAKMLQLGSVFPNFKANTTIGEIDFHEWLGNSWGILFSHPADFTPVCTTELARVAKLVPEFEKRGVKPIALSLDNVKNHLEWTKDIKAYGNLPNVTFPYPIIADESRDLSVLLNMLDLDERDSKGMPLTARAVFIIDANKKYRLSILYPATVGRNFDEILRVIDALQLTDKHLIATPADWKQGDGVMVQPTVPAEVVAEKFPNAKTFELPSGKCYLRETPLP